MNSLLFTVQEMENSVHVSRRVHVKKVARMVGQIISMAVVLGNMSQIMTRYLSMDILRAYTWKCYIKLSAERLEQVAFWKSNIKKINVRKLKSYNVCSKIVYSDASHSGYASYEYQSTNGIAHGQWSPLESAQRST